MNKAAISMQCSYLFPTVILFPSALYPELEFLDHVMVLFLIFWGTSLLCSVVPTPIYFPTNTAQRFPFSTSSPALSSYNFENHSSRCKAHCGFERQILSVKKSFRVLPASNIYSMYSFSKRIKFPILSSFPHFLTHKHYVKYLAQGLVHSRLSINKFVK